MGPKWPKMGVFYPEMAIFWGFGGPRRGGTPPGGGQNAPFLEKIPPFLRKSLKSHKKALKWEILEARRKNPLKWGLETYLFYITRMYALHTHEPAPECVCELNAYSIRVRRSPPRTEDVLYGVECGMRPLTSESHRRSVSVRTTKK